MKVIGAQLPRSQLGLISITAKPQNNKYQREISKLGLASLSKKIHSKQRKKRKRKKEQETGGREYTGSWRRGLVSSLAGVKGGFLFCCSLFASLSPPSIPVISLSLSLSFSNGAFYITLYIYKRNIKGKIKRPTCKARVVITKWGNKKWDK